MMSATSPSPNKLPSSPSPAQQQQTNHNHHHSASSPSPSSPSSYKPEDEVTLANKVADWLKRTHAATVRREDAIARVASLVSSQDQSASDLEDCVTSIAHQQLPALVPSIATVAESVSASAKIAESSYRKVTTIDRTLSRVNHALEITRAVRKMRASLARMSDALHKGDIDDASAAVAEYDETSRKLKGRDGLATIDHGAWVEVAMSSAGVGGGNSNSGSNSPSSHSDNTTTTTTTTTQQSATTSLSATPSASLDQGAFVQDTRQKVHEAAMAQLEKAVASLDGKALRSCIIVLSRLAFVDDAEKTFAEFIARQNAAELKAMVDKELESARSMRGASHLELVAKLLDHTVGCLEGQEGFVKEYLQGRIKLLLMQLHRQSAALCVEVLDDFLSQRKLHSSGIGGISRAGEHGNNSNQQQQQQQQQQFCDPVVADQQLEDLARLMVCCATYFNFLANRLTEAAMEERAEEEEAKKHHAASDDNNTNTSIINSNYIDNNTNNNVRERILKESLALVRKNNMLFDRVQDLLAIFVPLQIDYFDAACQVAIKDSLTSLQEFETMFLKRFDRSSSSSSSSDRSSGFFSSVAAALGADTTSRKDDQQQDNQTQQQKDAAAAAADTIAIPGVDAIDDIFFACRVAIHRVMATKSSPIASPTLMVVNNNVLKDKLLPLAQSRAGVTVTLSGNSRQQQQQYGYGSNFPVVGGGGGGGGSGSSASSTSSSSAVLTPKAVLGILSSLIWAGALSSISSNSKHLADEIGLFAEKFFGDNTDELLRFSEQRLDFVQTASASEDAVESACKSIANEMFKLCGGAGLELRSVSFTEMRNLAGPGSPAVMVPSTTAKSSSGAGVGGDNNKQGGGGSSNKEGGDASNNNVVDSSVDWVSAATDRFAAVLSNLMLPSAPWPDQVRCSVVASFLDCLAIELEESLRRKRYDLAGALRLDHDLRQIRNYFSATELDVPVREKFKRLSAMTSVLLSERRADAAVASNVLSQPEISALLKQRVDPPPP